MRKSDYFFFAIVAAYLLIILTACVSYVPDHNRCQYYALPADKQLCHTQVSCEQSALDFGKSPGSCYDNYERREVE